MIIQLSRTGIVKLENHTFDVLHNTKRKQGEQKSHVSIQKGGKIRGNNFKKQIIQKITITEKPTKLSQLT